MKHTTIGKTDEQIQKDKDFSSFEKNPITHDPRTKKQIKAYREKEKNRRRYIDDYKQWRKYKAAFGDDIPDFERFRAHKLKDDDKYKEWLHDFRSFRAKSAYTEMEASHKVRKVSLQYNRDNLTGTKLRNRLDIFGEDETVTREMFDKIKLTLDHRDGTHFEDLTYINTITKKGLINQNYNYYKNGKSECKPSKRMEKMQKAADDYTVIAIHNHPTSTFPSKYDIFSASTKRYKYGIIIAHDGTIYRYKTEPNFNAVGANTYIDILKKRENDMWRKIDGTYTAKETLEQLKYKVHQTVDDLKRFGVIIEVFKCRSK
jgi:proteasome lid subunit RPN8/RPN11